MPKTLKTLTAEQQSELVIFGLEAVPNILATLNSRERVEIYSSRVEKGTQPLERYIEALEQIGLDIGRGDCQYGWEMPVPEKGAQVRSLILFKRR